MHPLRNGSQATERPAAKPLTGSPGWFTESGDNNIPSYPGADWFNHVIAEFQNALAALGIPFVPGDDNHLADALKKINYKVFTFDYFADVISSELDLSSFLEVKTIQHSTDGLGGPPTLKMALVAPRIQETKPSFMMLLVQDGLTRAEMLPLLDPSLMILRSVHRKQSTNLTAFTFLTEQISSTDLPRYL